MGRTILGPRSEEDGFWTDKNVAIMSKGVDFAIIYRWFDEEIFVGPELFLREGTISAKIKNRWTPISYGFR